MPEVKARVGLGETYAILDARLVFAGPLEQTSVDASERILVYRPVWAVVFDLLPGGPHCGNLRTVFLDAATGEFVGYVAGGGEAL